MKAQKNGSCVVPNWLALLLCNILLVALFGLIAAAIMLAQNPPGRIACLVSLLFIVIIVRIVQELQTL
jgi:hypothetical protein